MPAVKGGLNLRLKAFLSKPLAPDSARLIEIFSDSIL